MHTIWNQGISQCLLVRQKKLIIFFPLFVVLISNNSKKDNELRDYTSARTVEAFKKFAESDYQQVKAEPVPEPVSAWYNFSSFILSLIVNIIHRKIQAYSFLGALEVCLRFLFRPTKINSRIRTELETICGLSLERVCLLELFWELLLCLALPPPPLPAKPFTTLPHPPLMRRKERNLLKRKSPTRTTNFAEIILYIVYCNKIKYNL